MYKQLNNLLSSNVYYRDASGSDFGVNAYLYQELLDAIIEQGADCFDGDIPEDLQAAADAKAATNSE